MGQVALVVPMAGRGSRFAAGGIACPKPLLTLWGKPFFWWSTQSALRAFDIGSMTFVVLKEHVEAFAIDRQVLAHYPAAKFVVLAGVTRGAAETASRAIEAIGHDGPLLVNDSDHAFALSGGPSVVASLANGAAAALLSFESCDPAYSYLRLDSAGRIAGTVEKEVASDRAIAGAYLFASACAFRDAYAGYDEACRYDEVYVSGLFDRLLTAGRRVAHQPLDAHISFGTPGEYARLEGQPGGLPWASWQ